jgi:hypothetical protein
MSWEGVGIGDGESDEDVEEKDNASAFLLEYRVAGGVG